VSACVSNRTGKHKFAYRSESQAVLYAVVMQARHKEMFDVYRCPDCLLWHIGSAAKRLLATERSVKS
jgi:hypothetical protein